MAAKILTLYYFLLINIFLLVFVNIFLQLEANPAEMRLLYSYPAVLVYSKLDFFLSVFSVFTWRHGGHVGVQNNSDKSVLGIWFYYHAKLEQHLPIVLYTNMAGSPRDWKPRIDHQRAFFAPGNFYTGDFCGHWCLVDLESLFPVNSSVPPYHSKLNKRSGCWKSRQARPIILSHMQC